MPAPTRARMPHYRQFPPGLDQRHQKCCKHCLNHPAARLVLCSQSAQGAAAGLAATGLSELRPRREINSDLRHFRQLFGLACTWAVPAGVLF